LKIYNSQQSPATFVVTLHEGQFQDEQVDGEVSVDGSQISVDATAVPPTATASPFYRGGGRGCGQQGRRMSRCGPHVGRGGRGSRRPHSHEAPIPPITPSGPHPRGPPFHHGQPPHGRGRGWRGPFNQPFPFPFPHPFDSNFQQQQQQQQSFNQNSGTDKYAVPPHVSNDEMRSNVANVVSSVITGVASMVNSNLQEEVQPTCTKSESESESTHKETPKSRSRSTKDAAANLVSSIFANVANIASDAVRSASPSGSSGGDATSTASAPMGSQFQSTAATAVPQAVLLEDVTFPASSTVPCGASFVKTWKVQNTGDKSWPSNLRLEVCGTDYTFSNASKDLGDLSCAPGDSVDLSITLIAPAEIGTYVEYFTLRDGTSIIGPYLCVDLQVVEGGEIGDWNVITSSSQSDETNCNSNYNGIDVQNNSPYGTWKLHMNDLKGHVQFYDTNGDTIFQLAFDENLMTMNSCVQSEWGGAEFVPIDPKQLPFEATVTVNDVGFEVCFEGPKRYVFRDGRHHLEAGEKILYMYKHRVPIRFFHGEVKTSGDNYNVSIQQLQQHSIDSESFDDDSVTNEIADMQEEMYRRYTLELKYLADMGFINFAVLFPILKAIIPIPASESGSGKLDTEQINEVVAMLVARNS